MDDRLCRRIEGLYLPQSLVRMVDAALEAREASARHQRVVRVWEATIQMMSTGIWAVCRQRGIRLVAPTAGSHGVLKLTTGQWLRLGLDGLKALAEDSEAGHGPLGKLVSGLDGAIADEPELKAVRSKVPGNASSLCISPRARIRSRPFAERCAR